MNFAKDIVNSSLDLDLEYCLVKNDNGYGYGYGYSDEVYGTFIEEPFELPLVMEMMLFWHIFAISIIGTMFYMTKEG